MARLIDADALKEQVEAHVVSMSVCLCMEEHYGKVTMREDCLEDIANAPTVDAIPVEWLECKRKEALKEGMRPDEVEAVEMVMWMWQNEQEEKRPEGNPECMGLGYEPCETCDSCCPYR